MSSRTDRNNNPTAFTTDIAKEGGLSLNSDYAFGDPFSVGSETFYTAKLIGNPLPLTIKVIDKIGFYTKGTGTNARWTYIAIPFWIWQTLTLEEKIHVIHDMYHCEGGTELESLFT